MKDPIYKFKFYSDAGHGWLAVKRKVLLEFLDANQISTYSYQRGGTVYLEEDCDASLFLSKVRGAGYKYEIEEKRSKTDRSIIRSYESYDGGITVSKL
jgi:hypothetical protein